MLAIIIGSLNLFIRTNMVAKFRLNILDITYECAKHDAENGLDWQWRYKAFESVSFDRMVWSFKRLTPENYYQDTTFLEMTDVRDNEEQHGNN